MLTARNAVSAGLKRPIAPSASYWFSSSSTSAVAAVSFDEDSASMLLAVGPSFVCAAVTFASRYQDRAVELVRDAVQKQPFGRRVAFWREILADPDLRPVRKRLSTLAMSDSVAERPKPSN